MWVEHVSGSPWVQWMPQSWTPRARIFNRRNVAGHTHTHTPLVNCGKTTVIHQQLEGNATQQNTKDKYTVIRRRVYYFSNVFAPACEVYFSVFCAKTFVSNENVLIFFFVVAGHTAYEKQSSCSKSENTAHGADTSTNGGLHHTRSHPSNALVIYFSCKSAYSCHLVCCVATAVALLALVILFNRKMQDSVSLCGRSSRQASRRAGRR